MPRALTVGVSLASIAECCNGELIGDPDATVMQVASLKSAHPDSLCFLANANQLEGNEQRNIGALLVRAVDAGRFNCNRIIVEDPYLAYARVSGLFVATNLARAIDSTALIDNAASLADDVSIGAYSVVATGCVIEVGVTLGSNVVIEQDVRIGLATVIESSVTICRSTQIGKGCHISPGVVIGASGFGYAAEAGQWRKIHQHGRVVIGDEVDIGANTTIDRGAIDATVIGDRVKLDNQIQIAHNVQVGDDTIIAGCVAIAGSAIVGKRCQIGGRASILGHLKIADDVVLQADAFVAQSVPTAGVYASMIPARPIKQWRKIVARLNQLDRLADKIRKLGKNNE